MFYATDLSDYSCLDFKLCNDNIACNIYKTHNYGDRRNSDCFYITDWISDKDALKKYKDIKDCKDIMI